MRKIPLLLFTLFLLLLCACAAQRENPVTVAMNGESFGVDRERQEIYHQSRTYRYAYSGDTLTITYPDGSTYWRQEQGGASFGGWSDDYDGDRYVPGDTLAYVLSMATPRSRSGGNFALGIFLFFIGLWNVLSPRTTWYLSHGWRYRDAEPSEMALVLGRVGGGVLILVGIIAFVAA